jgi:uncharacterized coiled-coil DUF342 family protein
LATGFGSWIFFRGKYKAETDGALKSNDRSEIENLKLITQEWREAAQAWKDMADEYQSKFIGNSRKVDELADQVAMLTRQLKNANKRIAHLEKEKQDKSNNTSADGNQ